MTTTISDLPGDLVEEIVRRIPLKHMRAVRSTCRNWRFCRMMRIGKEEAKEKEGETRMMVLMNYNLYLMSIVVDDKNPSTERKGKLISLNEEEEQVKKISLVYHCEGLLLCILKDDNTKLVVWNPYCGQLRWIEPRYFYRSLRWPEVEKYSYALGYKKSKKKKSHQVKILRFFDEDVSEIYYPDKHYVYWYEIYDLDSGLWTTLDVTPNWRMKPYDHGVSLKGNTYWCATRRNSSQWLMDRIICFDFTKERFGPHLCLPFKAWLVDTYVCLSCVKEEKLAVLYGHEVGIDIWVTTQIEPKKIQWSKFLTYRVEPWNNLVNPWRFFIDEVKKVVVIFDQRSSDGDDDNDDERLNSYFVTILGVGGDIRKMDLGVTLAGASRFPPPLLCSYVPGIVQIKPVKRKIQSILEESRFHHNLLLLDAFTICIA